MSTRDLLLTELYRTTRDTQTLALVARSAPVLYFDANEPFLPLASGYTLFTQDGPSPSFKRMIELRPDEKTPAAMAIEYAIWWDWDIHHLYELEHAWVYLDAQGSPVRVEASWHGKYYEIPLMLEEGHPVLLSQPGKHAFAPHPSWFEIRQRDFRRTETIAVGMHAGVLISDMFAGKIREQIFDRVLVRGYLARSAFDPAWRFNQRYMFAADSLVPWPALYAWIPKRVNAVLERLQATTRPENFRAMRVISTQGTAAGLERAARSEADAVHVPVHFEQNRLLLGLGDGAVDLDEAFRFLSGEPMGAVLEISDERVVDPLAWFVRSKELNQQVWVLSSNADLLARYNAYVSGGVTAIRLVLPSEDAVQLARDSHSSFVNPLWAGERLDLAWIETIHAAGIGIIGGPTGRPEVLKTLQQSGCDIVLQVEEAG